jgi:opacity protein-like surface antigen
MKSLNLFLAVFFEMLLAAFAGAESYTGKEMKQVAPPPCPEWYGDTEWNISIWGAYAFTGTDSNRSGREQADDEAIFGTYDRFLGGDHAWGGGLDVKYFFHRYFGVGFEGFAFAGRGSHLLTDDFGPDIVEEEHYETHDHTVGGALATFTLRYPIHCSRFSPYVWGGIGGMFGGHNDKPHRINADESVFGFTTSDDESRFAGQVGAGLEVRFTRHIGWIGDFSWNFIEGPHNNFGMSRTGLTFSF